MSTYRFLDATVNTGVHRPEAILTGVPYPGLEHPMGVPPAEERLLTLTHGVALAGLMMMGPKRGDCTTEGVPGGVGWWEEEEVAWKRTEVEEGW